MMKLTDIESNQAIPIENKRVINESIEVGPNVIVHRSGGRSVDIDALLSSDEVIKTLRTIFNTTQTI